MGALPFFHVWSMTVTFSLWYFYFHSPPCRPGSCPWADPPSRLGSWKYHNRNGYFPLISHLRSLWNYNKSIIDVITVMKTNSKINKIYFIGPRSSTVKWRSWKTITGCVKKKKKRMNQETDNFDPLTIKLFLSKKLSS